MISVLLLCGMMFLNSRAHVPSGMYRGEISVKDNTNAVTLNSSAKVQATAFDTNGNSLMMTPDHTSDDITVLIPGAYLIMVSMTSNNNAAQTHVVDMSVWKNDGQTELQNVHSHRTLSGGSGDIGAMPMSGLAVLAASDTLEMWMTTGDAGDRSITVEDVTLTAIMVGN